VIPVSKLVLSLSLALLPASAKAASDLSLEELIERHTLARGGRLAIESVESLEIELDIVEPTFEVRGLYRADRAERMRIDIFSDSERVFSEGHDGSTSWQWKGGAEHSESTTPEAAATLRHGAILNLRGLHELEEAGHKLTYLGLETLEGVRLHTLQITLDDGFVLYDYLDPESLLVVRSRSFRAFHPDVDPEEKWHETRYSDFRDVGGQRRPFVTETVDLATGETISKVTVKEIQMNPVLEAAIFEAP